MWLNLPQSGAQVIPCSRAGRRQGDAAHKTCFSSRFRDGGLTLPSRHAGIEPSRAPRQDCACPLCALCSDRAVEQKHRPQAGSYGPLHPVEEPARGRFSYPKPAIKHPRQKHRPRASAKLPSAEERAPRIKRDLTCLFSRQRWRRRCASALNFFTVSHILTSK